MENVGALTPSLPPPPQLHGKRTGVLSHLGQILSIQRLPAPNPNIRDDANSDPEPALLRSKICSGYNNFIKTNPSVQYLYCTVVSTGTGTYLTTLCISENVALKGMQTNSGSGSHRISN